MATSDYVRDTLHDTMDLLNEYIRDEKELDGEYGYYVYRYQGVCLWDFDVLSRDNKVCLKTKYKNKSKISALILMLRLVYDNNIPELSCYVSSDNVLRLFIGIFEYDPPIKDLMKDKDPHCNIKDKLKMIEKYADLKVVYETLDEPLKANVFTSEDIIDYLKEVNKELIMGG